MNISLRHLWHFFTTFWHIFKAFALCDKIQKSKVSSFRVLRLCIILRKIQIICGLPLLGCMPRVSGSLRTAEKIVLLGRCPFRGEWWWGGKLLAFMMSTGDEWSEVSNAVFTMRAIRCGSPLILKWLGRRGSIQIRQIRSRHETKWSNTAPDAWYSVDLQPKIILWELFNSNLGSKCQEKTQYQTER